jgi:hypothetical protein
MDSNAELSDFRPLPPSYGERLESISKTNTVRELWRQVLKLDIG